MTEEEIIYDIWNVVRGGEINQDDSITERLLRSFLRKHRGKHLGKAFNNGVSLPDEVFQYLGQLEFAKYGSNQFISDTLPKTVLFNHNSGIKLDYKGHPISVVDSEQYRNSSVDRFNKNHPLARYINNRIIVKNGLLQPSQLNDSTGSSLNLTVASINEGLIIGKILIDVQGVLVNPDDEPGYDWTKSNYPFPDQLVEDLINSVNAREFNLFLRMKSDEVADLRDDAKFDKKEQEL